MTDRSAPSRAPLVAVSLAILVVCAVQLVWAMKTRTALERVSGVAPRIEELAQRIDAIDEKVDRMSGDQEFLVDDVQRLARKVDDLIAAFEGREGTKLGAPPQPPQLDWTQPDLFEAARRSAAEVGVELTADEVRVPGRFVVRTGHIEYFAVLKGGKEHETLLSLVGNSPPGQRRHPELGVRINNAIQALGFRRGKPVRFTPAGPVPAEGEPVYLFVEWEEKGEKVLVRAEDLVWSRIDEQPMPRGSWVYVGSGFVPGDDPQKPLFAADLTAEAVATYSSPDTIVDTTAKGAQDDTVFLSATPRIPEDVKQVTLVIRRKDREATRTFPPVPKGGWFEDVPPPPGGESAPPAGQGR